MRYFQSIDHRQEEPFDGTLTTSCLDRFGKLNKQYFTTIESSSLKHKRPDLGGKYAPSNGISLKELLKKPDFGVTGYNFNSELRFNFQVENKIPQTKKNSYIDQIMKQKALIPSPDKYAH